MGFFFENKAREASSLKIDGNSLDISTPLQALKDLAPARRLAARIAYWEEGCLAGAVSHFKSDELQIAAASQLISLAAIKAEVGLLSDAQKIVERALRKDKSALAHRRYVGLTASLAPFRNDMAARYAQELNVAEQYRAKLGAFERLVRESEGSIAVVGNSPTNIGSKMGNAIDERRLVIRFNDYSVAPHYRADVGTKADVWVHHMNFVHVWRHDATPYKHRLVTAPLYWRGKNAQDLLVTSAQFGAMPEEMAPSFYFQVRSQLGARPSSGLAVLFWIRAILGSLDGVLITGFSMVDQLDGPTHYNQAPERARPPPHAWLEEKKMFDRLVAR